MTTVLSKKKRTCRTSCMYFVVKDQLMWSITKCHAGLRVWLIISPATKDRGRKNLNTGYQQKINHIQMMKRDSSRTLRGIQTV